MLTELELQQQVKALMEQLKRINDVLESQRVSARRAHELLKSVGVRDGAARAALERLISTLWGQG